MPRDASREARVVEEKAELLGELGGDAVVVRVATFDGHRVALDGGA